MEEKDKNSNISPRLNKIKGKEPKEKDKEQKNKEKSIILKEVEKINKFEINYKNKELNKFKDEMLSYLRNRDFYYLDKIKNLKSQIDITDQNLDNLSEVMQKNFCNILNAQADISNKLDKLKTYDAFINKANDKLISHEIRINCLREDLTKTTQKYDKIYLENLEIPGYIGRSSKYANCRIFFTEIIKEMDKCNTYREKNIMDLATYKERLENMIKMFQNLVDNNNDSQIKYITKLNDKTNKNLLETIEEKISNLRVDNSKYAGDLINKTNELNDLYNKIDSIKEYLIKEFNRKSDELNKKTNETNQSFEEYKVEFEIIRKKFLELADFIKNGKFSKNFGPIYGKKEINTINKKLIKDIKETIEPKDVKLLDNIDVIKNLDFKQKIIIDNNNNKNNINNNNVNNNTNINTNNNITNPIASNMNRISKSQNNFEINNNVGKRKNIGFTQSATNVIDKNRNSFSMTNKNNIPMKLHQGELFYLGDNNSLSTKNTNSQKIGNLNKNNLINEKDKTNKKGIMPLEKPKTSHNNNKNNNMIVNKDSNSNNIINSKENQNKENKNKDISPKKSNENHVKEKDKKEKENNEFVESKKLKEQKEEKEKEKEKDKDKKVLFSDELSMSESFISNINNSINTFSTTNDKNTSLNSLINVNMNNNKCNKFNVLEEDLQNNNRIIKELESELEQSTAKVNKLASNKKEIEDNFKSICNKIQPLNLKLNHLPLEKIPEVKNNAEVIKEKNIEKPKEKEQEKAKGKNKEKDIINKSEQNTTVLSHNLNSNNNTNEITTVTNNNNITNHKYVESKEKEKSEISNTTITVKSGKSKNKNKYTQHNINETLINDTINCSIEKKMNVYDKKIGDLECFTKEQILEIIKQINLLKKTYTFVAGLLKKDKNLNLIKLNGNTTSHNNNSTFDQSNGNFGNSSNNNLLNNENRNNLNLTGNNFYKRQLKNDSNSKFSSNVKIIQTMDDINFSDNLFYNGKYYFNIKDIFDKNKNNLNFNVENRKLLKQIDNKFMNENIGRNRNNSSNHKNGKNNISSNEGINDGKWAEIKQYGKRKTNKITKPQSGLNPSTLISSLEK